MTIPSNKADLITRMEADRAKIEATFARIPDSHQEQPDLPDGRSVKDIYAHLEFWTRRAIYLLDCGLRGETPVSLKDSDVDKINEEVFVENHARTLVDARAGERASYDELLSMVVAASEEVLFQPGYFPWAEGAAFEQWIRFNTFEHYPEHQADLDAYAAPI